MANSDLSRAVRRIPDKLRGAQTRLPHMIRGALSQPREVALYLPELLLERSAHPVGYVIEEEWQARMHAMLGAPWPCPEEEAVAELWARIAREMEQNALAFGRYTYGGYSDGDPAVTRAAWG